jgi:hypothetical protein
MMGKRDWLLLLWMAPTLYVVIVIVAELPIPWLSDDPTKEVVNRAFNQMLGYIIGFISHWWWNKKNDC